MLRLVLADDHRIILEGLSQLFSRQDTMEVVATCTDGEEALRAVRKHKPDVLVLDVMMPLLDGLGVLRQLQKEKQSTRVILLTATMEDEQVLEAIELGVAGLILKESASLKLLHAVTQVAQGERALDPSLVGRALERIAKKKEAIEQVQRLLSPRETEVVRMVASGLRNKEIATRLSISEGTVKFYLHTIYEKLEVHGRVELTLYAQDKGLI